MSMSFFCPCLNWLQNRNRQDHLTSEDSIDSLPTIPESDKRHYQGVRITGDNDTEQLHFNVARSKREIEIENVIEDCKSPLLNLLINTKNAISTKIQQSKELATDSISSTFHNSSEKTESSDFDKTVFEVTKKDLKPYLLNVNLNGDYQSKNVATVLQTIEILKTLPFFAKYTEGDE